MMKYLKAIFTLLLCLTALLGDYVVFKSAANKHEVVKAFADVSVHGAVGFWSSVVFFCYDINISSSSRLWLVLFGTFLAMIIDVDHCIKAGSFKIKDILNVKERGIFHNSSLWVTISALLLVYSLTARRLHSLLIGCMIFIGSISHHLRDANRRGLWFYPIGSTPALNTNLYLFLIGLLPNLCGIFFQVIEHTVYRQVIYEYKYSKITA